MIQAHGGELGGGDHDGHHRSGEGADAVGRRGQPPAGRWVRWWRTMPAWLTVNATSSPTNAGRCRREGTDGRRLDGRVRLINQS